jgi:hypothetical protein
MILLKLEPQILDSNMSDCLLPQSHEADIVDTS